jgi:hypothetical protein
MLQTGITPLHKACQYGHVRAVEKLMQEGADVLAVNSVSSIVAIQNQNFSAFSERKIHDIYMHA